MSKKTGRIPLIVLSVICGITAAAAVAETVRLNELKETIEELRQEISTIQKNNEELSEELEAAAERNKAALEAWEGRNSGPGKPVTGKDPVFQRPGTVSGSE